ncbi:MAG: zf-HC2 domain-containing protein [Archangiaceae bacterium]|nr:zf-HC2 domain-containing protein [Archangiaceae bacterium]
MTCAELEPLLMPYELGASTPAERDACETHLAACPACLAAFLSLKRVREDAAAFDERPSPVVRDRLRARVAARSRRRPVLWAAAAAALIAAALALKVLLQPPPPAPPSSLIDSAPPSEDLL